MTNRTGKKHFWIKMLLSVSIGILMLPGLCAAQDVALPPANPDPPAGSSTAPGGTTGTAASQDAPVTTNELLYQFNYKGTTAEQMAGTKIGAVNALPRATWTKALAEIVKILLNISGALALLAFTVGGAMMIFSSGNGDLLEKGKKVTTFAIAGLVIIAVSYALVIGVSELQIFPDAEGTPATGSEQEAAPAIQSGGAQNTGGGTDPAPKP